jgi:DNA-binding transcriptional ArsR family regulator
VVRIPAPDPGTVLFGKTRRRVLGLLFGHPDESFFVRDIVRQSGAAQGAIARELDALLGAGLLLRREEGRHVYYQANKRAPIFPELERLVKKTIALGDVLREALTPLAGRIKAAVIFGPAALGELKPGSDTDLLVLGDVRLKEVDDALATVRERLPRPVNPRVATTADPTLLSQWHLFVIGGPEDLGRPPRRRRIGSRPKEGRRWSRRTG